LGNTVDPGEVIAQNGAEVLRLWVAMLDFKEDAKLGPEILQRLVEAYRKMRNTWRFMLGNLADFVPEADSVAAEDMLPLDRWALRKTAELGTKVLRAYDEYAYHVVFHGIYNFFSVEMSAQYLDILKDRLYCSGPKSLLRRSAQTALFRILKDTLLLMAPILPFTSEEAWESLPAFRDKEESIHLGDFPSYAGSEWPDEMYQEMEALFGVREAVLKELEKAREEKLIGNSLEARVVLSAPQSQEALLAKYRADLASLFIVSDVAVDHHAGPDLRVMVLKAPGHKCERCWNISTSVGQSAEHPTLCRRCEDVVKGGRP